MTDAKRASIVAKIQALLAKTQDAGCTEAEAMSAAGLAAKLMQDYDITLDTVEKVQEDSYGARRRPFANGSKVRRAYHEVNNVLNNIAKYFDCKVWLSGEELVIFGSRDDTAMCHDMINMIKVAMDSEWTNNKNIVAYQNPNIHGRALRSSFMHGMTRRLNERFVQLKAERTAIANDRSTGTNLMIVKNQIVNSKYQEYAIKNNLNLKTTVSTRKVSNKSAFEQGKAAGSRVTINKTIG